jgi:TPR repeat protein
MYYCRVFAGVRHRRHSILLLQATYRGQHTRQQYQLQRNQQLLTRLKETVQMKQNQILLVKLRRLERLERLEQVKREREKKLISMTQAHIRGYLCRTHVREMVTSIHLVGVDKVAKDGWKGLYGHFHPATTVQKRKKCPVCYEQIPSINSKIIRMTCCGLGMHVSCYGKVRSSNREYRKVCPMCRIKYPAGNEKMERLFEWAERKEAWAFGTLGQKYRDGQGGVEKSLPEAIAYYTQAVQHGDAEAQLHLGFLYEHGVQSDDLSGESKSGGSIQQPVLEMDEEKANRLYKLAAEQGHAIAEYNLGIKLAKYAEQHEKKDEMREAKGWLKCAAKHAQEDAIVALRCLKEETSLPECCAYCCKLVKAPVMRNVFSKLKRKLMVKQFKRKHSLMKHNVLEKAFASDDSSSTLTKMEIEILIDSMTHETHPLNTTLCR